MAAVTLRSICLAMALCLLLVTASADVIAVTPSSPHDVVSPGAGGPGAGPAAGPAEGPLAAASCVDECSGWTRLFCKVKCYLTPYVSGDEVEVINPAPDAAPANAPATA